MNDESHSATQTEATDYTDVDELLELIEQLHLRQEQSERILDRVTKELEIIKRRHDNKEDSPQVAKFKQGDKVRVLSHHKNRYGVIGFIGKPVRHSSKRLFVVPEGKHSNCGFQVTVEKLELVEDE